MKYFGYIISIVLILTNFAFANSVEELCSKLDGPRPFCGELPDGPLENKLFNIDSFRRWSWLQSKALAKKKFLRAEIDNNKGMFRFLRSGFVGDNESESWYREEFKNIQKDFDSLRSISNQIDIFSKKLSMCYRVCSPSMQVDVEDKLRKLQRIKMMLLSKRPILASPDIEELVLNKSYDEKLFKKALVNTFSSYLSTAKDKIGDINSSFGKDENNYNFAKDSREEIRDQRLISFFKTIEGDSSLDDLSSEILSELDWESEVLNGEDSDISCYFYNKNKDYISIENIKDIGVEVGLVVTPILAGPAFRLGVWGLKGARILKWGMRKDLYANVVKASSGLASTAFFVKDSISLKDKRKKCESKLSKFIGTNELSHYQKYIECNEDYSSDILLLAAETTLVGVTSFKGIVDSIKTARAYRQGKSLYHVKDLEELSYHLGRVELDTETYGEAGFKLSVKKGDYYVLNLNGPREEVSEISSDYWEFVSETYKKRLNLSNEEVKNFIKSSKEMENRTTLFVSTEKSKAKSLRGGLAFVNSNSAEELLPFEKATGVRIDREKGKKIGEIVRFTVDEKRGDRKLSDELVSQLFSSFKSQDKVDSAYVFTSKSHKRLYERLLKKMKIPYTLTHDLGRDVIMKIDLD